MHLLPLKLSNPPYGRAEIFDFAMVINHLKNGVDIYCSNPFIFQPNKAVANSFELNSLKSSIFSPTPIA
jgi:hypothetical protein